MDEKSSAATARCKPEEYVRLYLRTSVLNYSTLDFGDFSKQGWDQIKGLKFRIVVQDQLKNGLKYSCDNQV